MMKNAEAAILQSEGSKFEDWGVKKMVLLHFCTFPHPSSPFCYWWLIMKKHSLMLYRSPNPNP